MYVQQTLKGIFYGIWCNTITLIVEPQLFYAFRVVLSFFLYCPSRILKWKCCCVSQGSQVKLATRERKDVISILVGFIFE